jgi:hypothetical protein
MSARNLNARPTKKRRHGAGACKGSHRRVIHSSRPPHTFTPFNALFLDPLQFHPQAVQLALKPFALLLGISNLLRDSEFPRVEFYNLCSMLCAAIVRDDGLFVL